MTNAPAAPLSALATTERFVAEACARLDLDAAMTDALLRPHRELRLQIPARLRDGVTHVFDGCRVCTVVPAARSRVACGSTPASTSTRAGRSPR